MEYSSAVLQRFGAPRGAPELPDDAPGLVVGQAEDRTLPVWIRFQLQVIAGIVRAARFQVYGCPHTVAAASLVAERLEGQALAAARALDVRAIGVELEVPVEKLGKLLRIEDALLACWRELPTGM